MAKKRNRADSRAHTPCPRCTHRQHGERGLRMHLEQVHELDRETAKALAKTAVTEAR